jgi:hypothetical protein
LVGGIAAVAALLLAAAAGADLTLTKTVTTLGPGNCPGQPSVTVMPGTLVTFCYSVTTSDPVTYSTHMLNDSVLMMVPLPNGGSFDLGPNYPTESVSAQQVVNTDITNMATWTAEGGASMATSNTASAQVFVITATASATATSTATATPTSTQTPTTTATDSPTPTASDTPSSTATSTATASHTATHTASATPSSSATGTATASHTATHTASATPSSTATGTSTATSTVTSTSTTTPTPSPRPPAIASGTSPGSTEVCGEARPNDAGCLCIVRDSPNGPTDLGCGSSDADGNFCIAVPPLQGGWLIHVEDRCAPFAADPLRGAPVFVGGTPAPSLDAYGLAISIALLSLIGRLAMRRRHD